MMEELAILCDGNSTIGAGHFFRCLAIADELKKVNYFSHFFIDGGSLIPLLEEYEYEYTVIDDLFSERKADVVIWELFIHSIQKVLIDSHSVCYRYLQILKDKHKITYIDDIPQFAYPVDAVVNGHVYSSIEKYQQLYRNQPYHPALLIGTKYFPIRSYRDKYCENRKGYLFLAGGSDPDHVTLRFLQYLYKKNIALNDQMIFIVGKMNHDHDMILKLCRLMPWTKCIYGKSDIIEEMKRCKIAVSAAGITLYELASFGTPTIAYSMVNNQIPVAKSMSKVGACIYVGDSRNDDIFEKIIITIMSITDNVLSRLSIKGKSLIDGFGSKRIAKYIIAQ